MPAANLRRQAFQRLLLCTFFWSLSFPAMKALALTQQEILPGAGSWFISSLSVLYRFVFAGGLLLLIAFAEIKTILRREIEQGIWLALFTSAGLCLQMDGLAYTSASTSAFLTQLYCVLIPLWVAVRLRRPPSVKIIFCGALVLGGMAVLVKLNFFALKLGRGEVETLAASVMFAAQILCLEHPRYTANRPVCFTAAMLLATCVFTLPLVVATAPGRRRLFSRLRFRACMRADGGHRAVLHVGRVSADEPLATAGHGDRGRLDLLRRTAFCQRAGAFFARLVFRLDRAGLSE